MQSRTTGEQEVSPRLIPPADGDPVGKTACRQSEQSGLRGRQWAPHRRWTAYGESPDISIGIGTQQLGNRTRFVEQSSAPSGHTPLAGSSTRASATRLKRFDPEQSGHTRTLGANLAASHIAESNKPTPTWTAIGVASDNSGTTPDRDDDDADDDADDDGNDEAVESENRDATVSHSLSSYLCAPRGRS